MRLLKNYLMCVLGLVFFSTNSFAHINPDKAPRTTDQVKFREDCTTADSQIDQDVNNVRARLTTGGDVWWDLNDAKYVVPKVAPGETEISSIFAGAVWLGGVDPGGNLKVAAQTYGHAGGNSDFWPGPLNPEDGTTDKEICDRWDKFFEVSGEEIDIHRGQFFAARDNGEEYNEEMIPAGVRGWPAKGNPYFFDVHEFELPNTSQGLAGFQDEDGDGNYDPLKGDYPVIEIRGCEEPTFPDEMIFWIYNDAGGVHGETNGIPIRMEVQVQTFAYATNDEINDMTFQRYKLINRALEDIDSTYFAMWVDADLGCHLDDYIGCDTSRSLAFVYNADAEDGLPGVTCTNGITTYGTEVPILGVDYFRGPLDENRNELGMSSFTYFNNTGGTPPADPNTTDPSTALEFYRYLSGSWRDGTPFTYGGDAYDPNSVQAIEYAFTEPPNDQNGWSMCTAGLPEYDRRTVQASGPFKLQPGAVNELIIGVVWVPDFDYPCPNINKLLLADDLSQALFNNCFKITDGPDAPDVDWIELDREVIAIFTNDTDTILSNNANELYAEEDLRAPEALEYPDNHYFFEGYLLYQLKGADVGVADLDDPNKARLIYQVDVKNGVNEIFNWNPISDPGTDETIWVPESMVQGADDGIRHTFRITEDQFASGDRQLINHKKYYFTTLAYAYNNWLQYDVTDDVGQRNPYLEGRKNIKTYDPIPRPITDRKLNSSYGAGAIITRIDGVGVGANNLDVSTEIRESFLSPDFNGEITYQSGAGPIDVAIYNPLEVIDGEFELTLVDEDMSDDELNDEVFWQLTDLSGNNDPITSDRNIDVLNEQILAQYGFTIAIGQTDDVGDKVDATNGTLSADVVYQEDGDEWLFGIPDDTQTFPGGVYNYIATSTGEPDELKDPTSAFNSIGSAVFAPFQIMDHRTRQGQPSFYVTPAWKGNGSLVTADYNTLIKQVNNVDVVFTSDKSKWSRCVVVETKIPDYDNVFLPDGSSVASEDNHNQFDVRAGASVGKEDADNDGLPDPDGDGIGMGWFPGYAVDVETGKRLNIFFGENSVYSEENVDVVANGVPTGRDMMFNPTSQVQLERSGFSSIYDFISGGQHFMYVTKQEYDECEEIRGRLDVGQSFLKKIKALKEITWAGIPILPPGVEMTSYADGLIPTDVIVKLRVDNPYQVEIGTGDFNGYPTYRFSLDGVQASDLDEVGIEDALDEIRMVPNPYYAFSEYEGSVNDRVVKITNLPAQCVVTIYSLDGKFIRQYDRDERGVMPDGNNRAIELSQIIPDIEWDLKNSKGIPISAGVYLVHIDAPGLGERTLKWFGVTRQFDPTGL